MIRLIVAAALAAACAAPAAGPAAPAPGCADVVEVAVTPLDPPAMRFDVTVRSDDTGWDGYADEWRVVAPDGTVLGARVLAHPHVEEQPFTRSHEVAVASGISTVTVEARHSTGGFCGTAAEVAVR